MNCINCGGNIVVAIDLRCYSKRCIFWDEYVVHECLMCGFEIENNQKEEGLSAKENRDKDNEKEKGY